MNEKFEKLLIERTAYKPSECNCKQCQYQCKTPCLGTPDDILLLLKNGYRERLSLTLWCVGMLTGHLKRPVAMVQANRTDNGCTFFHNGLCELHDLGLKPTEGRYSLHANPKPLKDVSDTLTWNVAIQWIDPNNILKVIEILQIMAVNK